MERLKRLAFFLCAAFLVILSAVSAVAESTMEPLLAASEWADYTVTLEERDGEFCGAIAENANGDRIFVIAMKNDNGKFELSVCFPELLPNEIATEEMTIHPIPDTDTMIGGMELYFSKNAGRDGNYVEFCYHPENDWMLLAVAGVLDGQRYIYNPLYFGDDYEYKTHCSYEDDGIRLSMQDGFEFFKPKNFSYEKTLKQAVEFTKAWIAEREPIAMETLKKAFSEADFASKKLVRIDYTVENGKCAVMAVYDSGNNYELYLTDTTKKNCAIRLDQIIPYSDRINRIQLEALDLEDDGWHDLHIFSFCEENIHYSFWLAYNDDEGAKIFVVYRTDSKGSPSDYNHLSIVGENAEFSYNGIFGGIYAQAPEVLCSAETFDLDIALALGRETYQNYLNGEAPYIPHTDGDYVIPQPCGARLKSGKWPVYSGPGTYYYRESNGKAAVSTNDWIQVFGREGEWALIQYRVSENHFRFGYVHAEAVENFLDVPELKFEYTPLDGWISSLTSDPFGSDKYKSPISEKLSKTARLAAMTLSKMYIEGFLPDGTPIRLFASSSVFPSSYQFLEFLLPNQ